MYNFCTFLNHDALKFLARWRRKDFPAPLNLKETDAIKKIRRKEKILSLCEEDIRKKMYLAHFS